MFKSDVLAELSARGFLKDCTKFERLDELLANKKITLYCGFDLTAQSLHVGNLVAIMILRHFQKCGHKVIVLLGGGTSQIGDPSGKDKERKILDSQSLEDNKNGVRASLLQFLDDREVTFVDNAHWLEGLGYIEFLNEVGRHFTLSKMLALESVKNRLEREQSMSFTEFNYSLLQSYDFYILAKGYDCVLQVGGSDQWGNIVSGTDFVGKKLDKEVFGLTTELITTADGKKMGKSENGAVWVRSEYLNTFEYFQFFRNVDDRDVGRFLRLYTELDLDEIGRLEKLTGKDINLAKERLAFEAVKICHGETLATECQEKARAFFNENSQISGAGKEVKVGAKLLDILVELDFTESKSEAKKLITQGAVCLGDVKITDINHTFEKVETVSLVVGKKRFISLSILN
jgi:tyrosyl-tRNA synthetase